MATNQRNCAASQLPWINASGEEVADSEALVCALQKRLRPSLHNLRRRHRPAPPCENQRRPGPPALSPETIRAVQQLGHNSEKALSPNAIPTEIYKCGGHRLMGQITMLFQEIWGCGQVPQDFKDAITVHLYKRKRNRRLVTITEAPRHSTSPGRPLLAFSSIVSTTTLSKGYCRKANMASYGTGAPSTWSLRLPATGEVPGDANPPLRKPSIRRIARDCGKSCGNSAVLDDLRTWRVSFTTE
ncbi:hypothetical protein SprV_0100171100 [Sparganum proliferum]